MKVVWILGAGFSIPLGGPGLADLFTLPMKERLVNAFAADDDWTTAHGRPKDIDECISKFRSAVSRIFSLYGWEHVDREWRLKPRWRDAEHCLDYVERAYDGGLKGELGRWLKAQGWKQGAEDWQSLRRVLAAVCHTFMQSAKRVGAMGRVPGVGARSYQRRHGADVQLRRARRDAGR